jgi:NAD(P)-dependent dehydrogenase (short-subunit alcohol dehydrogenase family)
MTTRVGKTFFLIGVSTELGRAFAVGALKAGHIVVGTVREPGDAEALEALHPGRARPACWTSSTTTGWWRRRRRRVQGGGADRRADLNRRRGACGIIEESTLRHRLATLP